MLALLDEAARSFDSQPISHALNPPAGPYALFHHLLHAHERVEDVRLIYSRLAVNRRRLTAVNSELQRVRPREWPGGTPYPQDVSLLMIRGDQITRVLKFDLESLFHFGSVLLDQWSLCVAYLAGKPTPEEHTFHGLVRSLDEPTLDHVLTPIAATLRAEARWLQFWMRTYRNRFVVHADRPWQRGTTSRLIGDEFNLFTPSPPGWENDEQLDAEILTAIRLAPEWLQRKDADYWERSHPARLLERIVENIGSLDRHADRERVAHLAGRKGLSTPTFRVLIGVLVYFISNGMRLAREAALQAPAKINLGPSRKVRAVEGPKPIERRDRGGATRRATRRRGGNRGRQVAKT